MEALAGLSIASNVIQVIGFAFQAIEIGNEVYKHGTTVDINSLNETSHHLTQMTAKLETSLSAGQLNGPLSRSDAELASLSRKAIKLKWRASRIEKSRKRLDEYVQVLDTKFLIRLSHLVDTSMLEQNNNFQLLDDRQQGIARSIAKGITSVEQLFKSLDEQTKSHVTQEHLVTRGHIDVLDKNISRLVDTQVQQAELDRFLQSLHFPEINLRQETITPAHEKTFQWIFEAAQDPKIHWDSFTQWLQSDEQLYWVLGKPGSGKSTLMNLVARDQRTQELLDSTGQPTTLLTFFFWENGVPLQKSQLGLLRSLLYQLLESLHPRKKIQTWFDVIRPGIPALPMTWTIERLLPLLQVVLQNVDQRLCLFLDGLDEFQGESDRVAPITALHDVFKGHRQLKMCISSRPELDLKPMYEGCRTLTMQAMTRADIQQYVEAKLLNSSLTEEPALSTSLQPQNLVEEVVDKAEGVFLWVKLAVESLLRGIKNDDSWDNIQQRLAQLPTGIFELYTHMWKRMANDQPIYAKEAAFYLRLVQSYGHQSLVELAILVDDDLHARFSSPASTWGIEHLQAKVHYEKTGKRAIACCAGHLEVRQLPLDMDDTTRHRKRLERSTLCLQPNAIIDLAARHRSRESMSVTFVHRTVADYLRTPAGQEILRACPYSEEEIATRFLKSNLIFVFLLQPFLRSYVRGNNFRHFQSSSLRSAVDISLELEVISEHFFAWNIWNLKDFGFSEFFCQDHDGEIDYTKAFISFSHVDYTKMKLDTAGLTQNRKYLTELLEQWATNMLATWPYEPLRIDNLMLLLQLGADPNHSLSDWSGLSGITIWQGLLLSRVILPQKLILPILQMLIEHRANLNELLTVYATQTSNTGDEGSWTSQQNADPSKIFMIGRWSSWDIAQSSSFIRDGIQSLLERGGAFSSRKLALQFEPPSTWRVLLDQDVVINWIAGTLPHWAMHTFHLFGTDLETLFNESNCQIFSNGTDAFRAAGWSDDEIRKEPKLRKIWEQMLSCTEGRDANLGDVNLRDDQYNDAGRV